MHRLKMSVNNDDDNELIKAKDLVIEQLKAKLSRSQEYAEELRQQVSKIGSQLGEFKKARILAETKSTQTEEADLQESTEKWNVEVNGSGWLHKDNIAETVTAIAEETTRNQGMVYEERSGMYYDYKSGYYYDNAVGMWYNGSSGTYFHYDEKSGSYSEMGGISKAERKKTETKDEKKKRRLEKKERIEEKRIRRLKKLKDQSQVSKEEGELNSDQSSESELSSEEEEEKSLTPPPPESDKIPCVRFIVKESDSIKLGSLFIVTCTGGSIGREGSHHDVLIEDIGCSKSHAKIDYQEDSGKYYLTDLGSRNGTWINGKRVSPAKVESKPIEIGHGSKIQIGKTIMLAHVHPHLETCNGCEPGLIQKQEQQSDLYPYEKESDRKQQMKDLKKKYALEGGVTGGDDQGNYEDRAEKRRKTVGSSNPHEKTQVASVNESISNSNKGFKMLAKMGWKEGEGLGKESHGRSEPVLVEQRNQRSGLGSNDLLPNIDPKTKSKAELWKKTQERFEKIN